METATRDTKPSGRVVTRWIAECLTTTWPPEKLGTQRAACPFNDRKQPKLHANSQAAIRESITHAVAAGHVGATQVEVRRLFKPRELASEEIVQ